MQLKRLALHEPECPFTLGFFSVSPQSSHWNHTIAHTCTAAGPLCFIYAAPGVRGVVVVRREVDWMNFLHCFGGGGGVGGWLTNFFLDIFFSRLL
jgi:hypothetical protein